MNTFSAPNHNLAGKLRLTSMALGCATTKELCGRFAAMNRGTLFTLQNCYKWTNGKARPRASSVYDDWAAVLGVGLSPQFIATATYEAFAAALAKHFFLPDDAVAALGESRAAGGPANGAAAGFDTPETLWSSGRILCGLYLGLSPAWSRAQRGNLIVGALRIEPAAGGDLAVTYCENLFGRAVLMTGAIRVDGRSAQATLTCDTTGRRYFLALSVPAPPASLVGGLLCGTALHDPEARPTASRIAFLRSQGLAWGPLAGRGRYIAAEPAAIAPEIAALRYGGGADRHSEMAAAVCAFLAEDAATILIDAPADALSGLAIRLDGLVPG